LLLAYEAVLPGPCAVHAAPQWAEDPTKKGPRLVPSASHAGTPANVLSARKGSSWRRSVHETKQSMACHARRVAMAKAGSISKRRLMTTILDEDNILT
jgi:hypothetical protein